MRPKSLLLLALALGCGLVASIGISQVMDKSGEKVVSYETESIYVATVNINLNDPIDESMVSLQDWPKDKVPQGAIQSFDELENRRPRTTIIQGEPILEGKLLAEGEVYDPIGHIPPGMRLKTISVDAEKSAAGLLSPGDRVDLQLFVARNPAQGFPTARTRVILQNIRIFAVDQTVQRAADGGEGRSIAKTVSLLLTPEQANKVALAEQVGELNLIPRSPGDETVTQDIETDIGELFGESSSHNSRKLEQGPRIGEDNSESGFFGGLFAQVKKATEERPPFVMTILEADQVREMEFDPFTGKPVRDGKDNQPLMGGAHAPTNPASNSVSKPRQGEVSPAEELQEEFGAAFPINF
ncbi:Flp pilus assembly protein CpaB [Aeoliella sp. ICT_H6.2]|uniref:Flp pilus assembly protein CpaB n=1 Tax=Aeoliella straminimaris TaxID=2954799 RepID=A0A9X2FCP7_9BACT|nr:Flp pilus assembly protein CpaB [Aeoliella straminimaris]MCO6046530.1 Flp pilus assembly protein CpaB [Aeoliella straminimaris]